MPEELIIDELGVEERQLLLRAFDYDVDEEGFILDPAGSRMPSAERPNQFLHVERDALVPGSLNVIDGSPSSLAKFLREREEEDGASRN